MEIQQAQKRKRETEAQILAIIQEFEKETGTCVGSVSTDPIHNGRTSTTIRVHLEVYL